MIKLREMGRGDLVASISATNASDDLITKALIIRPLKVGGLTAMPEMFDASDSRLTLDCPPINYTVIGGVNKSNIFMIDGQTYLGTANSLNGDTKVDVYAFSREYVETSPNDADVELTTTNTVTEQFIVVIPSLLSLPNCDTFIGDKEEVILDGVIVGLSIPNSSPGWSTTNPMTREYKTYLTDVVFKQPTKLQVSVMCLPGTNGDSTFTAIERLTDGGQINGGNSLPHEYIILGDISEVFTDVSKGVELELSQISQTALDYTTFNRTIKTMKSGILAIPLNF